MVAVPGPGQDAGVTVSSPSRGRRKLINMEGISGPQHPALGLRFVTARRRRDLPSPRGYQ